MYTSFNRFYLEMTKDQARSAFHQGACDKDVLQLKKDPKIRRQLVKISDEDLAEELKEYGAWDAEELSNREDNELRIVWLAAGNIVESIKEKRSTVNGL